MKPATRILLRRPSLKSVFNCVAIPTMSTFNATLKGEENLETTTHETTLVSTLEVLEEFERAIEGKELLAIDAEGVDLSRTGKATLLAVGTKQLCQKVHVAFLDHFPNSVIPDSV